MMVDHLVHRSRWESKRSSTESMAADPAASGLSSWPRMVSTGSQLGVFHNLMKPDLGSGPTRRKGMVEDGVPMRSENPWRSEASTMDK